MPAGSFDDTGSEGGRMPVSTCLMRIDDAERALRAVRRSVEAFAAAQPEPASSSGAQPSVDANSLRGSLRANSGTSNMSEIFRALNNLEDESSRASSPRASKREGWMFSPRQITSPDRKAIRHYSGNSSVDGANIHGISHGRNSASSSSGARSRCTTPDVGGSEPIRNISSWEEFPPPLTRSRRPSMREPRTDTKDSGKDADVCPTKSVKVELAFVDQVILAAAAKEDALATKASRPIGRKATSADSYAYEKCRSVILAPWDVGATKKESMLIESSDSESEDCQFPRRDGNKRYKCYCPVIHPHSRTRLIWLGVGLVFIMYEAFAIPMYLCFRVKPAGVFYIISSAITIYFLCDIVLNFFIGITKKDGMIVLRPAFIVKKYLRGWFVLDFVASIPLEWIELPDEAEQFRLIRFFRFLRLARLMRIVKMKSLLTSLDELVEGNQTVQFFMGLSKLLGSLLLTTHWAACIWWAVGTKERDGASWVDGFQDVAQTTEERYVWSMYFTLTTMTTVGYGDITPKNFDEVCFAVLLLPIASVLFASLMGNCADLITNSNERERQRQKKKMLLSHYMTWRGVPPRLRSQIRQCFLFMWDTKQDYEAYEKEVLAELPIVLKEELCLQIYCKVLQRVPFLRWMRPYPVCMRKLASMLVTGFLETGDFLFKVGDEHTAVYMLTEGTLYLSQNQNIHHKVEDPSKAKALAKSRTFSKAKDASRTRTRTLSSSRTFGKIGPAEASLGMFSSPSGRFREHQKEQAAKDRALMLVRDGFMNLVPSATRKQPRMPKSTSAMSWATSTAGDNIFKAPVFSKAHAELRAHDTLLNATALKLQRSWRQKQQRDLFRKRGPRSCIGLQQFSDEEPSMEPVTCQSSHKSDSNSRHNPACMFNWNEMKSHYVKAPAYMGESCLWVPMEDWDRASARMEFMYNAYVSQRAEVVTMPRTALTQIFRVFSPWLGERFEYFRGSVVNSMRGMEATDLKSSLENLHAAALDIMSSPGASSEQLEGPVTSLTLTGLLPTLPGSVRSPRGVLPTLRVE